MWDRGQSFQRAAHVLSRHYGGASFTHRSREVSSMSPGCNHGNTSTTYNHNKKSASTSSEDEEEIKLFADTAQQHNSTEKYSKGKLNLLASLSRS
ncbi:hypothetical protein WMY93_002714 [Mugilogobius chulae]|uniref:Uncharacterized protein n=1 Tax=Mugilogobius chulae TaxID=88201 RepID=A0AAW0PW67_9GOBI